MKNSCIIFIFSNESSTHHLVTLSSSFSTVERPDGLSGTACWMNVTTRVLTGWLRGLFGKKKVVLSVPNRLYKSWTVANCAKVKFRGNILKEGFLWKRSVLFYFVISSWIIFDFEENGKTRSFFFLTNLSTLFHFDDFVRACLVLHRKLRDFTLEGLFLGIVKNVRGIRCWKNKNI